MMTRLLILAAATCAWTPTREEVCDHGRNGRSVRVSLAAVERAQEGIRKRLELSVRPFRPVGADRSFESGLPACPRSLARRVSLDVPPALVGKTISFGAQGRIPEADLKVATSARSLRGGGFDALADPVLVHRLGVRCFPSVVIARSPHELDIRERP